MRSSRRYRLRRLEGPRPPRHREPMGYLDWCGWLADGVLAFGGWLTTSGLGRPQVRLGVGEHRASRQALCLTYPRPDLSGIPGATGQVLVARTQPEAESEFLVTGTDLFVAEAWYRWTGGSALVIEPDLSLRARAFADRESRDQVRALESFLIEECRRHFAIDEQDSLFRRNRGAWSRLAWGPATAAHAGDDPGPEAWWPEAGLGLAVERTLQLDERTLFLSGWAVAPTRNARLTLRSENGARTALALADAVAVEREDVAARVQAESAGAHAQGFMALLPLPELLSAPARACLSLHTERGSPTVTLPQPTREPAAARAALIELFETHRIVAPLDLELHAGPALHLLQSRLQEDTAAEVRFSCGAGSPEPRTSLVLTAHRGIEVLEPLLAGAAWEPEADSMELIVLLAEAEIERSRQWILGLSRLHRVPVRAIAVPPGISLAETRNLGAAAARAPALLFLDGNAIPGRPGWLQRLSGQVLGRGLPAVVAPLLLSWDGAVAEAGRLPDRDHSPDGAWRLLPALAGMPLALLAASSALGVPALGPSCLALPRALFQSLGGFHGAFLGDEAEAADLCFRANQEGAAVELDPGSRMVRLHEPVAPSAWTSAYDGWLAGRCWSRHLEGLPPRAAAPPPRRALRQVLAFPGG